MTIFISDYLQGACTELIIVSGFIVFLPKYLETQFNLSKSMVSKYLGFQKAIISFQYLYQVNQLQLFLITRQVCSLVGLPFLELVSVSSLADIS